mmetsp:Transcript_2214/g.5184  ORF Transcript_2214/g.5184 Transcript_2214/m.5184 type:complete len:321 (-) Transcript_2214:611-1573(-)
MRTSEGLGSKRRRSASAANSSTRPRAPFTGLALSHRGVVSPRARALLSNDPAQRCAFRSPGRRWRPAASASRRRSAFATKPRQRRGFPVAAKGPGRFRSRLGFDPTRPRRSRLCGARRTPRSSPVASKDASWPPRPAPRCSKFSSRGSSTSRAPCRGPVRSTSSCCTRAPRSRPAIPHASSGHPAPRHPARRRCAARRGIQIQMRAGAFGGTRMQTMATRSTATRHSSPTRRATTTDGSTGLMHVSCGMLRQRRSSSPRSGGGAARTGPSSWRRRRTTAWAENSGRTWRHSSLARMTIDSTSNWTVARRATPPPGRRRRR